MIKLCQVTKVEVGSPGDFAKLGNKQRVYMSADTGLGKTGGVRVFTFAAFRLPVWMRSGVAARNPDIDRRPAHQEAALGIVTHFGLQQAHAHKSPDFGYM